MLDVILAEMKCNKGVSLMLSTEKLNTLDRLYESDQKEIICEFLDDIFSDVKKDLSPQNIFLLGMIITKLKRSIKKYHSDLFEWWCV